MVSKTELKTQLLRFTASVVLWISLLGALMLCLSPLLGGAAISVAYGLGVAVAGLLSFSSLNVVATMAEDIRALRDSSGTTDQPKEVINAVGGPVMKEGGRKKGKEVGGVRGAADALFIALALSLLLLFGLAAVFF